ALKRSILPTKPTAVLCAGLHLANFEARLFTLRLGHISYWPETGWPWNTFTLLANPVAAAHLERAHKWPVAHQVTIKAWCKNGTAVRVIRRAWKIRINFVPRTIHRRAVFAGAPVQRGNNHQDRKSTR